MAIPNVEIKHPRIVILGSMGFIFSHVSEYFIKEGWDVHGFDNLSAGSHPELVKEFAQMENWTFHQEDVSHMPVVDKIVALKPDYIIHAAAISDVDYSIKNPTKTLTANNNATVNAFEAARKCKNLKRFLYVSTDEVYGECDHAKTEEEIIFPKNAYAASKAFGSILRLAYDNTYPELHDKTVETRFCNVFGPRQDDRKIMPAILRAADGGAPIALHNRGEGYRQWIYVREIPPVMKILLERGHRTYNITAGFGCTVLELIMLAEKILGRPIPTVPGKRVGMDMRYEMSSKRFREEFGWKPRLFFEETFAAYLKGKPL